MSVSKKSFLMPELRATLHPCRPTTIVCVYVTIDRIIITGKSPRYWIHSPPCMTCIKYNGNQHSRFHFGELHSERWLHCYRYVAWKNMRKDSLALGELRRITFQTWKAKQEHLPIAQSICFNHTRWMTISHCYCPSPSSTTHPLICRPPCITYTCLIFNDDNSQRNF